MLQVINSRLAMLGFLAGIGAEAFTHKGLLQQFQLAPLSIEATFLIFTGTVLHSQIFTSGMDGGILVLCFGGPRVPQA